MLQFSGFKLWSRYEFKLAFMETDAANATKALPNMYKPYTRHVTVNLLHLSLVLATETCHPAYNHKIKKIKR